MTKGMWLAVLLLVLYLIPVTQMALNPYPPAMRGDRQIVWVKNPQTKQVEPTLQAGCPAPVMVWGGWFGSFLNRYFFGAPTNCSGGGFGGGGGGAF